MRICKRLICVLLSLILLSSTLPYTSAHALEDDGIIRVLLTKLQLTDQIKVSLDGSYTLNDMAFQRGSQLIFSCIGQDIMLYYEGISLNCGEELTLLRHAADDGLENGFRVNGAYYLHPGNLHLRNTEGQLRAILHAPMEEYLLGVVPYEMSDSFPLEALKVQAIAARTYALRKKQMSTNDYDVVDNTNDQAYYGIQWENKNAIEAVKATEGICGFYKKRLAECFYSASNGGQTEIVAHVWGDGDYDYLAMIDDPYDLENPNSVVKRYTVPRKMTAQQDLGPLLPFIQGALSEQMETLGFDGDAENIQVVGIEKVYADEPKYTDSSSRIMTRLVFEMHVQGKKIIDSVPENEFAEEDISIFATTQTQNTPDEQEEKSFTSAETPLTIELPIFSDVITACDLDINPGVDNELITVTENEHSFVLESRRYGHGVGMSQRGAECMAGDYGWSSEQILRFYYPGVHFEKVHFTAVTPTPLPYVFMATPGPAATPTPKPTLMPVTQSLTNNEYKVIVNQISQTSYLNLRSEPSTGSSVVKQLYYGQILIVSEDNGEWLRVKTDDAQGYVMSKFVEIIQE